MVEQSLNDQYIEDLLRFNYKNLHESVWECHKVSWIVTSIFIPIIFAMQGYFIRDYFSALNTSMTGMLTFHVFMGAVVIQSLVIVWWLIMRIFSKFNEARMDRLKEIENVIHINNTYPIKQYELPYTLYFRLNSDKLFDWINSRKSLFRWDEVPGKDSKRLRRYLKEDHDIGWENVEIHKTDDDKTIFLYMADTISAETTIDETGEGEKSLEIRKSGDGKTIFISMVDKISAEKMIYEKGKKSTLKISDDRTQSVYVKNKNGKLKIYKRLDTNYCRIKITFNRVCNLILVVTFTINIALVLHSIRPM